MFLYISPTSWTSLPPHLLPYIKVITECRAAGHIPWEYHNSNDTSTPVFPRALFTVAKTWKQPRCPMTDEWIEKIYHNGSWYLLHRVTHTHAWSQRSWRGMWQRLEGVYTGAEPMCHKHGSLRALELVLHNKGSHCNEKPMHSKEE